MGQKKNQWHPGFAAAIRMELKDNQADLIFEEEHLLSKKPLQMDMLVVKNDKNVEIKNRIGKIFKRYNIIEYKSPQDSMGVDAFYKVIGYASLYKVSSDRENGYKMEDITITLVRQRYPAKLVAYLKENDCVVENVFPGIYYVIGNVLFTIQIIVSKDLGREENIWLHSLQVDISKETYHQLLDSVERLKEKQKELYGDAVLQVVTAANKAQIKKWKEESQMCEALEEIMAPELAAKELKGRLEGRLEGRQEGKQEGKREGKVLAFAELGLSLEDIAKRVALSVPEVERILADN